MIRLERARSERAIPTGLRGDRRQAKNRELLEGRLAGKIAFQPSYWRAAKPQLKRESNGKCAYCGASTEVVAHGDVEHFRPKSVYWWLAYCYDNMLFACQICNQVHKRDLFPVQTKWPEPAFPQSFDPESIARWACGCAPDPLCPQPLRDAHLALCRAENGSLLNPYEDEPEAVFAYRADHVLREVEVVPAMEEARRVFEACEATYGLNREELRRWRYRIYQHASILRDALAAGIPDSLALSIRSQLHNMSSAEGEFAGMVRFFLRRWKLGLQEP